MSRLHDSPQSIADLQSDLESALTHVRELDAQGELPPGLRPLLLLAPVEGTSVHVSLRHRDHAHQIRRSYGPQAFDQRDGAAWIVFETPPVDALRAGRHGESGFEPRDDFHEHRRHDERSSHGRQQHGGGDPLQDFLVALNEAESQPQLKFVSLKWFRDTYLPKTGYPWAQDLDIPRRLLEDATVRNLVLTSKVPNPKQPTFPVTSIYLNRDHPDVRRMLGLTDG
ncbi:MAG: hypothetical protein JNL28_01440 [Planctomycetes bacterium]|nr:hypothetical protein [Planctomycetota bacterium]